MRKQLGSMAGKGVAVPEIVVLGGGKGKGSGFAHGVVAVNSSDNVKAKNQVEMSSVGTTMENGQETMQAKTPSVVLTENPSVGNVKVGVAPRPCPFSDFRLRAVKTEEQVEVKTGNRVAGLNKSPNKIEKAKIQDSDGRGFSTLGKYSSSVSDRFKGPTVYTVTGSSSSSSPWPSISIKLEELVPPPDATMPTPHLLAATSSVDCGVAQPTQSGQCPSAEDDDAFEWVTVEVEPEKEKEMEVKKEFEMETDEKGKEKGEELKKEKVVGMEKKGCQENDLWATYERKRLEREKEIRFEKELQIKVEERMNQNVLEDWRNKGPAFDHLSNTSKLQASALEKEVMRLLFPGAWAQQRVKDNMRRVELRKLLTQKRNLKRKRAEFEKGRKYNGNGREDDGNCSVYSEVLFKGGLVQQVREDDLSGKGKEGRELFVFGENELGCMKIEEKERQMEEKGREGSVLFVDGGKEKGKMEEEEKEWKKKEPFVFGGCARQPMSYYKKAEEGSEVLFLGRPVVQVREELTSPEPGKICFMHRLQGGLQVASVLGGQSLGDWARQLLGERVWEGMGGYFTTKGGKVLNSETPVNKLGLHGSQEVVLQGRLRGGGYSGGGKGVRGGGGNSVAAGDWTCGICHQSGCWNAKSTCYRCGAPRHQSQGLSGQASSGVWDMEGRYQSGVGTGMGGSRVIGPTGRDQSSIPGGNPTQRKGPQPGGRAGIRWVGTRELALALALVLAVVWWAGEEEATTGVPSPGWAGVVGLVIRCHRALCCRKGTSTNFVWST